MEINQIVANQRAFFYTHKTQSLAFRKEALIRLEKAIKQNQDAIFEAFKKDFNKCEFDVLSTELFCVQNEIKYFKRHLKSLMRPKNARAGLVNFFSRGKIVSNPRGVVLVVSPWNYPLQLTLVPLVGAIAAGNTVVVKPSSYSPNVSAVIKKILSVFDDEFVAVVEGGREQNAQLFDCKFDFIFFTGSQNVAKVLMQKASANLTPVMLELGGKSPCIVDRDADIKLAAKRIVWGKFLNAGQTCVAPDYIWVQEEIKQKFVYEVKLQIKEQLYPDGWLSKEFPQIINQKHVERLKQLIDQEKLVFGGAVKDRLVEPTVLDGVTFDDAVMQEEIFGPIMPILTFKDFSEIEQKLSTLPKPLALYYFGHNKQNIKTVETRLQFGGGAINEVIMHLVAPGLPFGGVSESGMGAYHEKKSFEIFSHQKSVLKKGKIELGLKYPPHTKKKMKIMRFLAK